MHKEIERKFLVKNDDWRGKAKPVLFRQGYIARTVDRTARIRAANGKGYVTIKIKVGPISRQCGHVWEIDEFLGANAGLVVAEVELNSEEEQINLPSWAGEEVSKISKYFNSCLSQSPYGTWKK